MYCRGGNLPPAVGRFIFYISEQNGSEKRSRVDATFRRNYRRRNLREGYRHCPPQRSALKEVLKPWVSSGVFFRTFFSLLKRKCKHSRVNPSASLRSAPPFTQGRLWIPHFTAAPLRQNSQKIPWIFSLFTNKNPLATSDNMSYNTPISYYTRLIFSSRGKGKRL